MLQDGQEILEGRFQIIKKLGSGAFGEIYKGKYKASSAQPLLSLDLWVRPPPGHAHTPMPEVTARSCESGFRL